MTIITANGETFQCPKCNRPHKAGDSFTGIERYPDKITCACGAIFQVSKARIDHISNGPFLTPLPSLRPYYNPKTSIGCWPRPPIMPFPNLQPFDNGGEWQSVSVPPPVNGVYDLQLTDGSGSPGTFCDGYWSIASFHGKPLRLPTYMLKTFCKAWRTQK